MLQSGFVASESGNGISRQEAIRAAYHWAMMRDFQETSVLSEPDLS
jgi:hypothetical protein